MKEYYKRQFKEENEVYLRELKSALDENIPYKEAKEIAKFYVEDYIVKINKLEKALK